MDYRTFQKGNVWETSRQCSWSKFRPRRQFAWPLRFVFSQFGSEAFATICTGGWLSTEMKGNRLALKLSCWDIVSVSRRQIQFQKRSIKRFRAYSSLKIIPP